MGTREQGPVEGSLRGAGSGLVFGEIRIHWLNQSAFRIEGTRTIYVDPWRIPDGPAADVVMISHEHPDHCSLEDLRKIVTPSTSIVASAGASEVLGSLGRIIRMLAGQTSEVAGCWIRALPAYNLDKYREPDRLFHPRNLNGLSYLFVLDGIRMLHVGDSDAVPELRELRDIHIALVPVGGIAVMTPDEAAALVNEIRPKLAIPMHYDSMLYQGRPLGTRQDADTFAGLARVQVEIPSREGVGPSSYGN